MFLHFCFLFHCYFGEGEQCNIYVYSFLFFLRFQECKGKLEVPLSILTQNRSPKYNTFCNCHRGKNTQWNPGVQFDKVVLPVSKIVCLLYWQMRGSISEFHKQSRRLDGTRAHFISIMQLCHSSVARTADMYLFAFLIMK